MDKYTETNRLHFDRQTQVYIYAFMYDDTDTMTEEDYSPATR